MAARPGIGRRCEKMPGTEGAAQPFWSPDGKWVGFFARGKLKKAAVAGGSPQVLADAPLPRGGTWNARGDILFNPTSFVPIHRTTAGGGPATPLQLAVPFDTQDRRQSFPRFLPDGRHFLFATGPSIAVGSIDSPDVKEIASIPSIATYADGHLLFVRDGNLFAQSFDVTRLALSGEPTKIADNVRVVESSPDELRLRCITERRRRVLGSQRDRIEPTDLVRSGGSSTGLGRGAWRVRSASRCRQTVITSPSNCTNRTAAACPSG